MALHAWRTRPLTSIEHAPHTSSRHEASHTTGATVSPPTVTGFFRISPSAAMTFMCVCHGTSNSSQRVGRFGPSARLIFSRTVFFAIGFLGGCARRGARSSRLFVPSRSRLHERDVDGVAATADLAHEFHAAGIFPVVFV